jgi:hypothetical protein
MRRCKSLASLPQVSTGQHRNSFQQGKHHAKIIKIPISDIPARASSKNEND